LKAFGVSKTSYDAVVEARKSAPGTSWVTSQWSSQEELAFSMGKMKENDDQHL
jgi:hypothetical protein